MYLYNSNYSITWFLGVKGGRAYSWLAVVTGNFKEVWWNLSCTLKNIQSFDRNK